MPLFNNPFEKNKTLEELQEDDEKTRLQYSIEEKRAAIREAKRRGIDVNKSFGGSISALIRWFKTH